MLKFSFLICFVFLFGSVGAQPVNWIGAENDHGAGSPRDLIYSENLDLAVYCGRFYRGQSDYYFAGFNGSTWEILEDSVSSAIKTAVDFSNGLLVGGSATFIGTQNMPHMAYYENGEWSYPYTFDDDIAKLTWANDTLFALGFFEEIDGSQAYRIAKLVGDTWVGVLEPSDDIDFALFEDIVYYNGDYYVAGNFQIANGPSDFGKLENGAIVEAADDFVAVGGTIVTELEVFQDELYLSGTIYGGGGDLNAGNHLLRFDGESYSKVGCDFFRTPFEYGGLGHVLDMVANEDYLYCSGSFLYCDDFPVTQVARWDGEEWCSLYGDSFHDTFSGEQAPRHLTIKEDTLMMYYPTYQDQNDEVGTHFWLYTGGQMTQSCTGPLSEKNEAQKHFQIFPNPSTGNITLESESPLQRISAFDAMGRLVFQESVQNKTNHQLNLSHLPKGLYLLQISGGGFEKTEKVVIH